MCQVKANAIWRFPQARKDESVQGDFDQQKSLLMQAKAELDKLSSSAVRLNFSSKKQETAYSRLGASR